MKTKRVRIAVIANEDGQFFAFARHNWNESASRHIVETDPHFKVSGQFYWVEADLPIPENLTVKGEVVG